MSCFLFAQFIFDVFFMYCHYKLKCLPKLVLGEADSGMVYIRGVLYNRQIKGDYIVQIAPLWNLVANQSAWFLFKMPF